jgi:hypothetical protein
VESKRTIRVPYKGLVYADPQTGAVVRIEMECEIPDDSECKRLELAVDYKAAEVAGREFILPFHFHMRSRQAPNAFVIAETVNEADYNGYRRFEGYVSGRSESQVTSGLAIFWCAETIPQSRESPPPGASLTMAPARAFRQWRLNRRQLRSRPSRV